MSILLRDPVAWYRAQYAKELQLYPDQLEFALNCEKLTEACLKNQIEPVQMVYMSSRQAGKNETSARLEARLMHKYANDKVPRNMIKTAPTHKPQLLVSQERLEVCHEHLPLKWRYRKKEGYKYFINRASCTFLSAEPSAKRHGETVSLLLECDEAQDIQPSIYLKDFEPMTNVWGVPVVFYGTAWDNDNLLERMRRGAREQQEYLSRKLGTNIKLLWETTWDIRAEHNPRYGAAVEQKIRRLGETHPIILTQYMLKPIDSMGKFFDDQDMRALVGGHHRFDGPRLDGMKRLYIAGVDLCSSVEQDVEVLLDDDARESRDSTVAVIGELSWNRAGLPLVRVVDMLHLPNMTPLGTEQRLKSFIWGKYQCIHCCVDASGVGNGVAKALEADRPNNVTSVVSTSGEVSEMGFELIGAVKTGRMTFFRDDNSREWREFYLQCSELKREMLASGKMRWYAPRAKLPLGEDGVLVNVHDDIPKALGYLVRCADKCSHLYQRYEKEWMEGNIPEMEFGTW